MISVSGIYRLKPNDNIRILQTIPTQLKNDENSVKKIIGNNIGIDFYIVEGKTLEETLANETTLTNKIKETFPTIDNPYIAINSYIPTLDDQKENFNLVSTTLSKHALRLIYKRSASNEIMQ